MKIVIAPDSFKESLSSLQVANAIEAGMRAVWPDATYVKVPMADGGEGTVQAMVDATGGRLVEHDVTGPLGETVTAFYGLIDGGSGSGGDSDAAAGPLAVIEMAAASGLEGVPKERRDPLAATSRGTGELIKLALDAGARRFVLGVGGSATNDGGAGMLQALGVKLLDDDGREIGPGGGALARLSRIDASALDARVREADFQIASDVTNPLVGPQGASAVFGPQKGATPDMVARLDANLQRFADVVKRDLGRDVAGMPGAGAGGGIAAAMVAVLNGRMRPGIEIVAEAVGLDAAVLDADLVVTGEGRIDGQTLQGKTPMGVAKVARAHGKPVIGIGGSLAADAGKVHAEGIRAVFAAVPRPCSIEDALAHADENLRNAARNVAAALELGAELSMQLSGQLSGQPSGRHSGSA